MSHNKQTRKPTVDGDVSLSSLWTPAIWSPKSWRNRIDPSLEMSTKWPKSSSVVVFLPLFFFLPLLLFVSSIGLSSTASWEPKWVSSDDKRRLTTLSMRRVGGDARAVCRASTRLKAVRGAKRGHPEVRHCRAISWRRAKQRFVWPKYEQAASVEVPSSMDDSCGVRAIKKHE